MRALYPVNTNRFQLPHPFPYAKKDESVQKYDGS